MGQPAKGRSRVMITVSDTLLERVDEYCDLNGLGRSAFFATASIDKLNQQDMQAQAMNQFAALMAMKVPDIEDLQK